MAWLGRAIHARALPHPPARNSRATQATHRPSAAPALSACALAAEAVAGRLHMRRPPRRRLTVRGGRAAGAGVAGGRAGARAVLGAGARVAVWRPRALPGAAPARIPPRGPAEKATRGCEGAHVACSPGHMHAVARACRSTVFGALVVALHAVVALRAAAPAARPDRSRHSSCSWPEVPGPTCGATAALTACLNPNPTPQPARSWRTTTCSRTSSSTAPCTCPSRWRPCRMRRPPCWARSLAARPSCCPTAWTARALRPGRARRGRPTRSSSRTPDSRRWRPVACPCPPGDPSRRAGSVLC